ncbi:hypothetical protein, partial [Blastopirellula marina]|uniref:hypothetical protein n=1 Tax=Blastopirellula marina TaxID=124 RepID=UPI0013758E58
LILQMAVAVSVLLLASNAYAATPPFSGPAPNGNFCIDNGGGFGYGYCAGLGYNLEIECPDWCDNCYDGDNNGICDPGPPPAAVPELEDYAAALFLGLALLMGWQVRQRQKLV